MVILAAVLLILLIVSVIMLVNYRRQIKLICRQLSFKKNNTSNLIVKANSHSKELIELAGLINENLKKQDEIVIKYKQKDSSLKETITNLSHDIRTPLTSLDGYFQLLKNCDDEQTKEKYISVINGRIISLKEMLEELFVCAKLQDDAYEIEVEPYNINKILLDTAFSFYEDFKKNGIEPVLNIPDNEMYVLCSDTALKRVFQNIIKNSVVHGEKSIKISLGKQNDKAVVEVSNKFNDINKIDETRVFDRFYKADTSRSHTSTGLGLSIARELILKMNGNIYAEKEDEVFKIVIKLKVI